MPDAVRVVFGRLCSIIIYDVWIFWAWSVRWTQLGYVLS